VRWIYQLKIGTKLLTGFIFVAIIAGVIGYIGIKNIRDIVKLDTELYETNTVPIIQIAKVADSVLMRRIYIRDMLIVQDEKDKMKHIAVV
jgi:methyl-accepting chemotaxis protein